MELIFVFVTLACIQDFVIISWYFEANLHIGSWRMRLKMELVHLIMLFLQN